MKTASLIISLLLVSCFAFADDKPFKNVGNNKVYYSAFNSSFISADIANIYSISRGKDKGLVNIAIVPEGSSHGTTALIGGSVNNLIAQQQVLEFSEIREGDAVYYLAPFHFENEDALTFTLHVRPSDTEVSKTFTFQRTFYHDQ